MLNKSVWFSNVKRLFVLFYSFLNIFLCAIAFNIRSHSMDCEIGVLVKSAYMGQLAQSTIHQVLTLRIFMPEEQR